MRLCLFEWLHFYFLFFWSQNEFPCREKKVIFSIKHFSKFFTDTQPAVIICDMRLRVCDHVMGSSLCRWCYTPAVSRSSLGLSAHSWAFFLNANHPFYSYVYVVYKPSAAAASPPLLHLHSLKSESVLFYFWNCFTRAFFSLFCLTLFSLQWFQKGKMSSSVHFACFGIQRVKS